MKICNVETFLKPNVFVMQDSKLGSNDKQNQAEILQFFKI